MLTIYIDGQPIRVLVDTGADITILTERRCSTFPIGNVDVAPLIGGVRGQDSQLTTCLVHWKDLNDNKGAIHPIFSMVLPRNFWDRDILEDMGTVQHPGSKYITYVIPNPGSVQWVSYWPSERS